MNLPSEPATVRNSVNIEMDTRVANVGPPEILKIIDVPFDSTGQKPEIALTLHTIEGFDDRLNGLNLHKNGHARIFCVPHHSLGEKLNHYLTDKYSLPEQWFQRISERSRPAMVSSDIQNVSLQWNQHVTNDSLPPQSVATITDRQILSDGVIGIQSSHLICLNCDENKLLGTCDFKECSQFRLMTPSSYCVYRLGKH